MNAAQGRSLGDYLAVLRRRWLVFTFGVLLVVALGVVYLALAPKTYTSTTKVLVEGAAWDSSATGARTTDGINLDTEAQVVRSFPVAELAEQQLDTGRTLPSLTRDVTVTVPPNTTVLQIAFQASDPSTAQEGAEAFADAYLEHRAEAAQNLLDAQLKPVEAQLEAARKSLKRVGVNIDNEKADAARASLRAQRTAIVTRLEALNTQLAMLATREIGAGQVINEAQVPSTPTSPDPWLVIPASVFAGLLLGLVLALWRDARAIRRTTSAR